MPIVEPTTGRRVSVPIERGIALENQPAIYEQLIEHRKQAAVDYSTFVSSLLNVCYLETPKAGCTTIKAILNHAESLAIGNTSLAADIAENPKTAHLRRSMPTRPISELRPSERQYFLSSDKVFRFCFVRNPYSRVLSAYLNKIRSGKGKVFEDFQQVAASDKESYTFEEFLRVVESTPTDKRDPHWLNQTRLVRPDIVHYHFVGKMESFSRDIDYVRSRLPRNYVREFDTSPRNATGALETWTEHYNAERADLVVEIYREDFRAFGYSTEL